LGLALSVLLAGAGAHGFALPILAVAAGSRLVLAQPGGDDGHPLRRATTDGHAGAAAVPLCRVLPGGPGVLEFPGVRDHSRLPVLLSGGAIHPAVPGAPGHLSVAYGPGGLRTFSDRPGAGARRRGVL